MKNLQIKREPANYKLVSEFSPQGDQPQAIEKLVTNLNSGSNFQTLLGVTGSGKTYTMANVIERLKKPALVIAPNKTLAAQLYREFKQFFPENRVSYFVSYYDYYQPEAYIPSTDTYIEKDSAINDEIDKMRHSATRSVLEARDSVVVASVSCIYGLGAPEEYFNLMIYLEEGQSIAREELLQKLVYMQYERADIEFARGTFRVRGEVIDIFPGDQDSKALRVIFFGDTIEELEEIDSITGVALRRVKAIAVYPLSHFLAGKDQLTSAIKTIRLELNDWIAHLRKVGKLQEAERIATRTNYDLEMLKEVGFCPGIENYSRHLAGRKAGEAPTTLIDYFPEDFLVFIDESHVTVSQIGGMYAGDRSRKSTLVEHGFRLPSALDNRPLNSVEFWQRMNQVVFVSATPGDYELEKSVGKIVEQINRPTGLLDPLVEIRPALSQVDDLIQEIKKEVAKAGRVLVTTLTKKMAEDLSNYFREEKINARYLHSDIKTIERVELIDGLKRGDFDVLIGINLLREGLDIVEVSLVAVLDADKEGFLRSTRSLIQTMGRAARNIDGRVILYADKKTKSIEAAIAETTRRRLIQEKFNKENNITPVSAKQQFKPALIEQAELNKDYYVAGKRVEVPKLDKDLQKFIEDYRKQMFLAASKKEFELAAEIRDLINDIQKTRLLSE